MPRNSNYIPLLGSHHYQSLLPIFENIFIMKMRTQRLFRNSIYSRVNVNSSALNQIPLSFVLCHKAADATLDHRRCARTFITIDGRSCKIMLLPVWGFSVFFTYLYHNRCCVFLATINNCWRNHFIKF